MTAKWTYKNLGDVCQVIGGGTPSKERAEFYGGNIPWATVRDMRQEWITDTEHRISEDALKNSAANIIPAGNVVIATRVGLGKVSMVAQGTAINQDLRGLVPNDPKKMDPHFLFWWAKHVAPLIVKEGTGATVQGVKVPFVKSLKIPVLPLQEQRRIVGILDEAFDGIAAAKANAEKNLQNAKVLSDGYLQAIFAKHQSDWVVKSFGDLAEFRNGINFTKSSRGETLPILGVREFQNNFWAPLDDLETVTIEGKFPEDDALQENDLVFVRSNGNVELIGRCVLVGPVSERIAHSGFTIRARLKEQRLFPKYICHFLKSSVARRKMIDSGIGTNIKSLSQGVLASLDIPVPPLNEQKKIVEKLERFGVEGQHLQAIYQRKLAALAELKQSLLHQAFSGAL